MMSYTSNLILVPIVSVILLVILYFMIKPRKRNFRTVELCRLLKSCYDSLKMQVEGKKSRKVHSLMRNLNKAEYLNEELSRCGFYELESVQGLISESARIIRAIVASENYDKLDEYGEIVCEKLKKAIKLIATYEEIELGEDMNVENEDIAAMKSLLRKNKKAQAEEYLAKIKK